MTQRLGRPAYFVIWLVLVGAQIGAAYAWLPGKAWIPLILVAGLLQLAKVPLSIARLNQLALPWDDAFFALVPFANLGLWLYLLRADPGEKLRADRLAKLQGTSSASSVSGWSLGVMVKNWRVTVPLAILVGAPAGFLQLGADWVTKVVTHLDADTYATVAGVAWLSCLPFAGYLVIQLIKMKTASWASWVPALLLAPAFLFALGVQLAGAGQAMELQVGALITLAVAAIWTLTLEAVLVGALVVLASDARARRPTSLSRIQEGLGKRLFDLITFHGAVFVMVQLGMIILVPGIIYAVQSAFVQPIVMLRPHEPRPIRRSFELARPMWRSIFKVMLFAFLLFLIAGFATTVGLGALLPMLSSWFDPFVTSAAAWSWAIQLAGVAPDYTHSELVIAPVEAVLVTWIWGLVRVACTALAEEQLEKHGDVPAAAA